MNYSLQTIGVALIITATAAATTFVASTIQRVGKDVILHVRPLLLVVEHVVGPVRINNRINIYCRPDSALRLRWWLLLGVY